MAAPHPGTPNADESTSPGVLGWIRSHGRLVLIGSGVLLALIAAGVIVAVVASSGGGGTTIQPGTIVGRQLTTGYKVSGKVKARSDATVTVQVTSVDYASGDPRNAVFFVGATVEFDRPAEGTTAIARNNHIVATPAALHPGDKATVVGEFTSVLVPPGTAHNGYAFLGIEATSK